MVSNERDVKLRERIAFQVWTTTLCVTDTADRRERWAEIMANAEQGQLTIDALTCADRILAEIRAADTGDVGRLRAALRLFVERFGGIDNGYCACCGRHRLHDTHGNRQPCSDPGCISALADRALSTPTESAAAGDTERLDALEALGADWWSRIEYDSGADDPWTFWADDHADFTEHASLRGAIDAMIAHDAARSASPTEETSDAG